MSRCLPKAHAQRMKPPFNAALLLRATCTGAANAACAVVIAVGSRRGAANPTRRLPRCHRLRRSRWLSRRCRCGGPRWSLAQSRARDRRKKSATRPWPVCSSYRRHRRHQQQPQPGCTGDRRRRRPRSCGPDPPARTPYRNKLIIATCRGKKYYKT